MKIFHVVPKIKNGGVEAAAISALKSMNNCHNFKLISIESSPEDGKLSDIINLKSSITSPLSFYKFIKIVYNEQPDMIIFSLWKSSLLGLVAWPFMHFRKQKVKTTLIIHSARYAHFFDRVVTKLALRVFDTVYFDSESSQKFTLENSAITGEVLSFILRRPQAKAFDYKCTLLRFVFIGRLNPVKNIDRAIDFIKMLNDLGVNVVYHIYGPDEGVLDACLKKVINYNLSDKILYKGTLDTEDVPSVLRNYDFYLQFSKAEGMAMSVVEAMQVGLVPCVTNVGQIDSYAEHLRNSFIVETSKLSDDKYLKEMAMSMKKLSIDCNEYHRISKNAAASFNDKPIYSEDLENKIINNSNN